MEELKGKPILIYDIETRTHHPKRINGNKDKLKVFACYSYLTDKTYMFLPTDTRSIIRVINAHKFLVGFNNIGYDNLVLANIKALKGLFRKGSRGDKAYASGKKDNKKINIDLREIFKKRASGMKIKAGMLKDLLMEYSLDFITQTIGIVDANDGKIGGFAYAIFRKAIWTPEDIKLIKEYTERDIDVTRKLFEWVEEYFSGFPHFLKENDIANKSYLTDTLALFTAKVMCNRLKRDVITDYSLSGKGDNYGGGYVAYPSGDEFEGEIFCIDFSSLYPFIMFQCNLYTHAKKGEPYWNGDGFFKVKGKYSIKNVGEIEKTLFEFYTERLIFKKNKDPREYTNKIVINTTYGLSGDPCYVDFYNFTTAYDCTSLGRQFVMLGRQIMHDDGYEILYTDTDSIYLKDPFIDKERMVKSKQKILDKIAKHLPFPSEYFDMTIDDEIANMWFFKGKNERDIDQYMDEFDEYNKKLGLMKKNYIYLARELDKDGNRTGKLKLKVKNLGVRKKSTSAISRTIFWDYVVPRIMEERKVRFPKSYFHNLIYELLEKDIKLALVRKSVKHHREYKLESDSAYQISKMYGEGIHFLIPNKRNIGAGTNKKYCTMDEFKEYGMTIQDIDLRGVWSELGYFIEDAPKTDWMKFAIK